jgi:hypothetical protein
MGSGMNAEQIQQQIVKLEALKVAAEKEDLEAQMICDEQKARREAAAEGLRQDRAARLTVVFEKMEKQASFVSDRYRYMVKAYGELLTLAEEAQGLLPADHCEPGGLIVELNPAALLTLCERDLFKTAGTRVVPDGKQEIRRPRAPGAYTTSVEPKYQIAPTGGSKNFPSGAAAPGPEDWRRCPSDWDVSRRDHGGPANTG